jgi:phosphoglycolate phosphatase
MSRGNSGIKHETCSAVIRYRFLFLLLSNNGEPVNFSLNMVYNVRMKNIIFDWSGVVRDTVTNQMWIVNHIFKQYGVAEISTEEFRENWKQPPALFYQKYLPQGYNEDERSKLFQKLQLEKDCPAATSFPEVVKLIHTCKEKGYFLAVVSSDFPETLLPEVSAYGLENVFSEIITDANDKLEPVKKILKEHKLNLEDTYFVGDSNHEIDVSKKTGIKSVAVTWGFTSESKLKASNPDYVAHKVEELANILL